MTMAPTRVKLVLVHKLRFDLSVLLMGSTSSDNGNSERLGFQLTYLSGEKSEKSVFFPCFLNLDQALSQSVENLSPAKRKTEYTSLIFAHQQGPKQVELLLINVSSWSNRIMQGHYALHPLTHHLYSCRIHFKVFLVIFRFSQLVLRPSSPKNTRCADQLHDSVFIYEFCL